MSQKELLYPIAMNEDHNGNLRFILKGPLVRDVIEVTIRRCPVYDGRESLSGGQIDVFLEEAEIKAKLISKMRDTFGLTSVNADNATNITDVFLDAAIRYISADAKEKIVDHLDVISKIDRNACNAIDRGLAARKAWRSASGLNDHDEDTDGDLYSFHEIVQMALDAVRET